MRFLLVVAVVLGGTAAHAAGKQCVRFSQQSAPATRTLTLELDNGCEVEMDCSMSWAVRCLGERGSVKSTSAHEERRLVPAGASATWTASAAACGEDEGWTIASPVWSCRQPAPASR